MPITRHRHCILSLFPTASRGREKVKDDLLLATAVVNSTSPLDCKVQKYNVIDCSHRQSRRRARLEMGAVGAVGKLGILVTWKPTLIKERLHGQCRKGKEGWRAHAAGIEEHVECWWRGLVICYHHKQGNPSISGPLGNKHFKSILLIQRIMCVCPG